MRKEITQMVRKYGLQEQMIDYIEENYDDFIMEFGNIENFIEDFIERVVIYE